MATKSQQPTAAGLGTYRAAMEFQTGVPRDPDDALAYCGKYSPAFGEIFKLTYVEQLSYLQETGEKWATLPVMG